METVCFSETLESTYESTSRQKKKTEEHHDPYRRENLKYHMKDCFIKLNTFLGFVIWLRSLRWDPTAVQRLRAEKSSSPFSLSWFSHTEPTENKRLCVILPLQADKLLTVYCLL
jgi:hypothetical protein